MEDITGLGKLAESKLASTIYADVVSPAVREVGSAAADVVKTMRLFTAPFQLAAVAQDRFKRWLDEVRSRVPIEDQVEARPSVAGPALRAMQFLEEDNPLVRMYVSLLAQAIDKGKAQSVHPAFVRVLEQISPDEAVLLLKLRQCNVLGAQRVHHPIAIDEDTKLPYITSLTSFPQDEFIDAGSISMYFEHLQSLSLVRHIDGSKDTVQIPPEHPEYKHFNWHTLTSFGDQFLEVCGQA